MLWILALCFGATIIKAAPSSEILGNSIEFNDDVINDHVELSDTVKPSLNFNEPFDNDFQNFEILGLGDKSPDSCDSNIQDGQIQKRNSGACAVYQHPGYHVTSGPREGVTHNPPHLDHLVVGQYDPQCVDYSKRPKYVTCSGPEVFFADDLQYDAAFVINCVFGKHSNYPLSRSNVE